VQLAGIFQSLNLHKHGEDDRLRKAASNTCHIVGYTLTRIELQRSAIGPGQYTGIGPRIQNHSIEQHSFGTRRPPELDVDR
jgi:hypothetical protein